MTESQHPGRTAHSEQREARPARLLPAGLLIGLFIGLLIIHGACMSSDWEGPDPVVSPGAMTQQIVGVHPAPTPATATATNPTATATAATAATGMGMGMTAMADVGDGGHHEQHGRPGHHHPRQLPCCDHQAPHDPGALLSSSASLLLGLTGLTRVGLRIHPPHPVGAPSLARRTRTPHGTPRLALCVLRI